MDQKKIDSGIRSTSNFCAHRLKFSPEKVQVKPAAGNYIFFSIFIVLGLLAVIPIWSPSVPVELTDKLVFTGGGLLFVGIGLAGMFWKRNRMPEIDLIYGRFYPVPQKIARRNLTDDTALHGIPLGELDTIEAESRVVSGRKSTYTNYRLILTFRNGHRCSLLSHGGRKQFIEDAEKLAQILHKPLTGMEEIKTQQAPHAIAGCGMIIFSIFWLTISCNIAKVFFSSKTWEKLNFEYLSRHPEHLLIFMPVLFILVGVILLIIGIRHLGQALWKELKKDYPGLR